MIILGKLLIPKVENYLKLDDANHNIDIIRKSILEVIGIIIIIIL